MKFHQNHLPTLHIPAAPGSLGSGSRTKGEGTAVRELRRFLVQEQASVLEPRKTLLRSHTLRYRPHLIIAGIIGQTIPGPFSSKLLYCRKGINWRAFGKDQPGCRMHAAFCWASRELPGEKPQVPRSSAFIWASLILWVPKPRTGHELWGWECMGVCFQRKHF